MKLEAFYFRSTFTNQIKKMKNLGVKVSDEMYQQMKQYVDIKIQSR